MAQALDIPIIVTAEDIPRTGRSCQKILDNLPSDCKEFNKMTFGLADDQNALEALEKTNKKTAILTGFETDVCVCHSALGLYQRGYSVAVVQDATSSPGTGHMYGIDRLRGSGVILTSTKGIYYEWLHTVKNAHDLQNKFAGSLKPPDSIIL